MIVTAYQTLEDRDNIDEIETDGPYECRRPDAWLGFGYYFWDTNMDWAIGWGETAYSIKGKEFVIGRCGIDLTNNCFDLIGKVEHQQDLIEAIEVMKKSGKIKPHHRFILANIIQFLRESGLFQFKVIRAADNPTPIKVHFKEPTHRKEYSEYMMVNQRVQICVVEKKGIFLPPFSVVYPEKYLI